MAITIDDFSKIWASTSPLTPYSFSDDNYKNGWNFVGGTPPSRQMWDFLQKNNDEKMQYLANNYLPLSGGTMTGNITFDKSDARVNNSRTDGITSIYGGVNGSTGALAVFHGKDHANSGQFHIYASDGSNSSVLAGRPDGTLKWNGVDLGGVLSYTPTRVNLTNKVVASSSAEEIPIITATIKGIYYFTYNMYYNFSGTGNCRCMPVLRNSGVDSYRAMTRMVNSGNILSASFIATLNVGDSVRFRIENNTDASWTTSGDDTANHLDYTLLRALQ